MKMLAIHNYVLATLAYFDMFDYPLTETEVYLFLNAREDVEIVSSALRDLVKEKRIFKSGKFYSLKVGSALAERRETGNKKASELYKVAERVGKILIRFPYVRGVAISGSLSKSYADDTSDIDLFIIAAKNRLWIARTFMHLLKKLSFLVGKQHLFCMNYYVDESELEIAEKNLYTAIEVVTLIPIQGDVAFENFYSANLWVRKYLPNNILRIASARAEKKPVYKKLVEMSFKNALGNQLESRLMNLTRRKWDKKTERKLLNLRGVVMSMKAEKYVAKPDPSRFQENLISRYEQKVLDLIGEPEALRPMVSSSVK